jgi:CheY-like chemotaxis protein
LPATTTPTAVERHVLEKSQLPRGSGERILVIDDEVSVRDIAKKTLERFGYRVLLAADGAEAIATYARLGEQIALVLTDMAMPIMDGVATISALKRLNPDVKVIASSGLPSNAAMTRCAGLGVVSFVPKPYTAEVLLRAIHEVITSGQSRV